METRLLRRTRRVAFGLAVLVSALGWAAEPAHAAPFQNLDFEAAVLNGSPGDLLPIAEALPGWSGNNFAPDGIVYDQVCVGQGCISIHDSESLTPVTPPLQGELSVILQGPNEDLLVALYIAQTGLVPSEARRLRFRALNHALSEPLVYLGGVPIPLVEIPSSGPWQTLVGDVSAFAGTTAELRFATWETMLVLDAIAFVPEPGTAFLLAGGIAAAVGRRCARRPSSARRIA
jgi:hypothetical protein